MFLPPESPERVIDIWKMRNVYLGFAESMGVLSRNRDESWVQVGCSYHRRP